MRQRGLCSVCFRKYEVFTFGTVRNHWVPFELRDKTKGKFCAGSGRPPHGSPQLLVEQLQAPGKTPMVSIERGHDELIRADERRRIIAWVALEAESLRYDEDGWSGEGADRLLRWMKEYFGLVDSSPEWGHGYNDQFPREFQ